MIANLVSGVIQKVAEDGVWWQAEPSKMFFSLSSVAAMHWTIGRTWPGSWDRSTSAFLMFLLSKKGSRQMEVSEVSWRPTSVGDSSSWRKVFEYKGTRTLTLRSTTTISSARTLLPLRLGTQLHLLDQHFNLPHSSYSFDYG
jgi:hypothetical protein